jgi:hypothetical protein
MTRAENEVGGTLELRRIARWIAVLELTKLMANMMRG